MRPSAPRSMRRETELEFEHSPPRSAGNSVKVLESSHESYWTNGPGQGKKPKGKQFQGGYGGHWLCAHCNRFTGRWYVPYFSNWTRQGQEKYDLTGATSEVFWTPFIFPLPVLKEITAIFLARNGAELAAETKQPLTQFVLSRSQRGLSPRYRFWAYFVAPGPLRNTPFCSIYDIHTGAMTTGMEFWFPPFGYMLTIDSVPEDKRLCEITHFARYDANDAAWAALGLVSLPTHSPVIGDYRSFKEMGVSPESPEVVIARWPNVVLNME